MFGFFRNRGEREEIGFEDAIGILEGIERDISIDMSYRNGRKRDKYREISPEQAKGIVRSELSPDRDFSLGERYDGVNSLIGAVTVDERLPERLYTDVVYTVTEDDETAHHTLEIAHGFLYCSGDESSKGKPLREAEISYDLPIEQD